VNDSEDLGVPCAIRFVLKFLSSSNENTSPFLELDSAKATILYMVYL